MDIVSSILHKVHKDAKQTKVVTITPRKTLFNTKDQAVIDLLGGAVSAFRKTSSKGYAVFQKSVIAYPLSNQLDKYLTNACDFMALSISAMDILKAQMTKEALATGGYILFCHYKLNQLDFLLIMQLKIKPGTGIDEVTLDVKENINLDIEHLHEAARINVAKWRAADGKYISFVKKASNSQPTKYFRDFIGCDEFEDAKAQTNELVLAVESYCESLKLTLDQANEIKEKVFFYCEEKKKEGQPISLAALATRINEKDPTAFIQYIDDNLLTVPDSFDPIKDAYKHLKRVGGKDKDLTINFNRSLLGKRVVYDKVKGELLIKQLPQELKDELDSN
ncbi:Nucleoid-associated protein YejK [Pseudomonas fluorescens]|uniref:Nucleoid-associated protein YejK n=1 Tax=Pseudomonas fluorescens TaxID=294 RepID=A0A5E6T8I0_PSEFL|nr:nucleoid-associated protein [Pseudomonas fluorescens]VVM89424.1 Nucleoid-associated protein YejK [Pseudomonas fluorescens]